jgi:hypothetical protein
MPYRDRRAAVAKYRIFMQIQSSDHTPVRAPKANGVYERLGGSLRRECLGLLIPFNELNLRMTIRD